MNSLLKIDSISRLTNKMRALHEDTVGLDVKMCSVFLVTARDKGKNMSLLDRAERLLEHWRSLISRFTSTGSRLAPKTGIFLCSTTFRSVRRAPQVTQLGFIWALGPTVTFLARQKASPLAVNCLSDPSLYALL